MRIGVISDTHGLLRGAVFNVFEGVDLILHAGDVGSQQILDELGIIAPVHAVYGNTDYPGEFAADWSLDLTVEGQRIHMEHGHRFGSPTPALLLEASDADIVVYGHTHRPLAEETNGRLVLNPGAAGPMRFELPPTVALLELTQGVRRFVICDL